MAGKQGEETASTSHGTVLKASRRVWMADNVEDSSGPTEGPSKKRRRERENENYVGGMRNPAQAVKLAEAGKDMCAGCGRDFWLNIHEPSRLQKNMEARTVNWTRTC